MIAMKVPVVSLSFLDILFSPTDFQNSTVVAYLNPECTRYAQEIKIGTEIIVGHSPGRDSKWLLDGGSLLMNLNENYRNQIHNFIIVSYHLMCNRQR